MNPSVTDTCDAISLDASATTCQNLPNFPATVFAAIGGLGLNRKPIICGGAQNNTDSDKCYSLENREWVSSASMNSLRFYTAAVQWQDDKLLVTGGYSLSVSLNNAEMLTEEGWKRKQPSLPVGMSYHCMITVNSTTLMVVGGIQNGLISGNTFFFNFRGESWIEGPELNYKRIYHSCGIVRRGIDSQEMSVIVAGGHDGLSYLSSVEILDEDSNEWQTGPELPLGIQLSQMVRDPNGGVVLVGGDSPSKGYLDTLYQLPHGGREAEWTKMQQKLKIGRQQHTAFLVPDNIFDCS